MRFHILNVGHGFCAYLAADNGNLMMFDCGHSALPLFRPSDYLYDMGYRSVQRLFVTNFDEDHISDLPNLLSKMTVAILNRNPSLSVGELRRLKMRSGPISNAMQLLLQMMNEFTAPVIAPPDFPRVSWKPFHAPYGSDFQDTNNLSLVTFLYCAGTCFLLPGDLEEPAWRYHLRNQYFRTLLGGVNVFIASHHGRQNGYCGDVFSFCRPDVFVFSDSLISHATQEMSSTYASHANGIWFNGQRRFVLSTRNDGDVFWDL